MTTTRTPLHRRLPRSGRAAALVLAAGAGFAFIPSVTPANAAVPVTSASVVQSIAPASAAQVAVRTALDQVGKPYATAGSGPGSFDCSGLTRYAYGAAGVNLPHSSRAQSTIGYPVSLWDMQPGDLLFFYSPVGHVGMYLGNGMMVHSSTYGQPVAVVPAASVPGYVGSSRPA